MWAFLSRLCRLQLLPDSTHFDWYLMEAIEILRCAVLYLQSLDFSSSTYGFVSTYRSVTCQMTHMDTDLPSRADYFCLCYAYRHANWPFGWRSLFSEDAGSGWQFNIFNRQITSFMGLPQSIEDNQIHYGLPLFHKSSHVVALSICIKMCQIIAETNLASCVWNQ